MHLQTYRAKTIVPVHLHEHTFNKRKWFITLIPLPTDFAATLLYHTTLQEVGKTLYRNHRSVFTINEIILSCTVKTLVTDVFSQLAFRGYSKVQHAYSTQTQTLKHRTNTFNCSTQYAVLEREGKIHHERGGEFR